MAKGSSITIPYLEAAFAGESQEHASNVRLHIRYRHQPRHRTGKSGLRHSKDLKPVLV